LSVLAHHSVRTTLWLAFFAAIVVAWWMMYSMAGQMGLNWYGARVGMMDMAGMPPMNSLQMLVPMWAIMMIAMMGPTFVHTMTTYEALMRSANGTWAGLIGVVAGYFIVWVLFGAGIALVQAGLMRLGWLDMFGQSTGLWATAALLIVVGWFQFTWIKEVCHGVCHAPMQYFLGNWRTGGSMNLLWMGLATVLMVFEKLPQVAHYVMRPVGVLLIVAGLAVAGCAGGVW
jgi:predicted metal-binding membrane protein